MGQREETLGNIGFVTEEGAESLPVPRDLASRTSHTVESGFAESAATCGLLLPSTVQRTIEYMCGVKSCGIVKDWRIPYRASNGFNPHNDVLGSCLPSQYLNCPNSTYNMERHREGNMYYN